MQGLTNICASSVKGAHDSDFVIVDGKAYIVYIANDRQPGENPKWDFLYVALSVVDVKSGSVGQAVPFASADRVYDNATLPHGAAFVPRIIRKDGRTLRCFFNSENPGAYEARTWAIDYDIGRGGFENRIYKARLKTAQGVFDMQPQPFYQDAVAHGFTGKPLDYGLYVFDHKTFDGITYFALNNYPVGQNALAVLGDDKLTFEVLGHYNEPVAMKLTESAVNRLPDGTWLAICRQEGGTRNYAFTQSKDGKTWTPGEYRNVVRNGTSSKPTFDRFGGVYYLGWQEATGAGTVSRSVFNVEVSRDGINWERKYRFGIDSSPHWPVGRTARKPMA